MTEANPLDEFLVEAPHRRAAAQGRPARAAMIRSRARIGHRWFAACAILLFTAADYKFRVRSAEDTLAGRPDVAILVEIGIFVGVFLFLIDQFPPSTRV